MVDALREIRRSAEGRGARSTVVQPLLAAFAVVCVVLAGVRFAGEEGWLLIAMFCLVVVVLTVFLVVFCYFAWRNPDLLRSERYLLLKQELDRAAVGDNLRGVLSDVEWEEKSLPPAKAAAPKAEVNRG